MKNMEIKEKEAAYIYNHDLKYFNEVLFESELRNVDWNSVHDISKKDIDFLIPQFF